VLLLLAGFCNNRVCCGGKRFHPARNVAEPPNLSSIGTKYDYCGKFLDVILRGELLILPDSLERSLLSLIKVKLAQKEVVLRVVGKFPLIEHLAVQLKAGNAPIRAYECKQERSVRSLGQGSRSGEICIVTDVAAQHRLN